MPELRFSEHELQELGQGPSFYATMLRKPYLGQDSSEDIGYPDRIPSGVALI